MPFKKDFKKSPFSRVTVVAGNQMSEGKGGSLSEKEGI